MTSFQAIPLNLTMRVGTRISSRPAEPRAADNIPTFGKEASHKPGIAAGNLATPVFRGQDPIKRVVARSSGRFAHAARGRGWQSVTRRRHFGRAEVKQKSIKNKVASDLVTSVIAHDGDSGRHPGARRGLTAGMARHMPGCRVMWGGIRPTQGALVAGLRAGIGTAFSAVAPGSACHL